MRESRHSQKERRGMGRYAFLLVLPIFIEVQELILRWATVTPFWGVGLWYSLLFSLAAGGFAGFVFSFFRDSKGKQIVFWAFCGVFTLYYMAQMVYFKIFGVFCTIFSMFNGGQAFKFITMFLNAALENIFFLLLFLLPLAGIFLLRKGIFGSPPLTSPQKAGVLLSSVAFYLVALLFIAFDQGEGLTANFLYHKTFQVNAEVSRFGMLTSARLDIKNMLFPAIARNKPAPKKEEASPVKTDSGKEKPPEVSTPIVVSRRPEQGKENVLPLDFEKLIAAADSDEIKELHTYFSKASPTATNEHTGKFADYNLITITAEAFCDYAVSEELTPTLYRMIQEGYQFPNFYNPGWGVSTSDGEYVANVGIIPKAGVWSYFRSATIALPFTMGNQFRLLGYTPHAYHNNTYDYYNRDLSHPNAGYLYQGLGNGLEVEETWPESDLEMMQKSGPEYIGKERFHTFYMTVSGHMEYTTTGNMMAYNHWDKVKDLPYNDEIKCYLACNIELDLALGELIRQLEA
ncbi:MAG: LTA synthase family protein, partial [Oscillospiraceae bacterium]